MFYMKYLYEGEEYDGYICDIDPIWESEFILMLLSKDRLKNKKELSYVARYQSLLAEYYNTKSESEYEFYEKELAKLENTEIIKQIVEREGPEDLILEMTFAKITLNMDEEKVEKQPMFGRIMYRIKKWFQY